MLDLSNYKIVKSRDTFFFGFCFVVVVLLQVKCLDFFIQHTHFFPQK